MTPITCAKPSPPRGRSPSSPTTRHGRSNIRSTSISMPSALSSNAASRNSSSSDASQPASKRLPEITAPSSLSQPSFYGCDKCPHHLGRRHVLLLHAVETQHLLRGRGPQPLIGGFAGLQIGRLHAGEIVAHVDDRAHG